MASEPTSTEAPRLAARSIWTSSRQRLLARHILHRGAHHGLIALADQAIVSGVNFATLLFFARYLPPADYGIYVLLFAILLFINGLQSSLITAPLMVLAPRHYTQSNLHYLNSLWLIQLVGCLAIGILVAAFMPLGYYWWPTLTAQIDVVPIVLVVITYLGQEFLRRVLFVQHDGVGGLAVDLISYGLQFVVLIVLVTYGSLTLRSVLWAIGLTSMLSCLFGMKRARPKITSATRKDISTTWQLHWEQGQWLTSSMIAQWSSNQLYFFVVAAMLSPAATGMFAASRNLFGFTHIFLLGLENFVPATVTRRLLHHGIDDMVDWLNRFRLLGGVLMGVYCLTIFIFANPLMHLLFGPHYPNTGMIVLLSGIAYFISIFARPSTIGLRALGKPRWIFFAFLASGVVTIIVAVPLVAAGGIAGAAVGMIITQVILLVVASLGYRRVLTVTRNSLESKYAAYKPAIADTL